MAATKLTPEQVQAELEKRGISGLGANFGDWGLTEDSINQGGIIPDFSEYIGKMPGDIFPGGNHVSPVQDVSRRGNLFGIFADTPMYDIPPEVQEILDLYRNTSADMISTAQGTRQSAMEELRSGRDQSISELTRARDEALGYARGDISRIRDIQTRAGDKALQDAYRTRKETLAELQRGGDKALDIQRLQAFGGMPGERLTQEQMQSDFASMQQSIRERAGGGSGALGAISEGYGSQLGAQRQLGIDRANYQAQGMSNLAQGELATSGRMAEAMMQTGNRIGDVRMQTANNLSSALLGTSQYYTGMIGNYGSQLANTMFNTSQGIAGMDLATAQNLQGAQSGGAQLVGGGLAAMASQKAQQFQINQLDPYNRQTEFLINEMRRLDPFGVEAQYYGDLIGQGYGQYMSGVQGGQVAAANRQNAWNSATGTAATAAMLYGNNGGVAKDTGGAVDEWGGFAY